MSNKFHNNQFKYRQLKTRKKHRLWTFMVLSMAVILLTAHGLTLTAITMQTVCGQEAHIHTEECYSSESSFSRKLICGVDNSSSLVAHYHDDYCYDIDGSLMCSLEETDGHFHSDECYA